jgi:Tetratricopeptide repeat
MKDRQHDRIARIREEIHQAFQAEIAQVGDTDAVIVAEELAQITQVNDLDEGTTTGDREPDRPPADTALAADSVVPRHAEASLAQGRDIGRPAHNAVDASELLAAPGRDLRILSHSDREETQARVTRMRELLSEYPARRFGVQGSAKVLDAVATVSEALIADRDERTAVRLMRVASPHLKVLGRHDQGGFRVRRTWAEAWSELGHYRRAERLLRRLSGDEQQVKGFSDPQTAMLLLWTLIGHDQLQQAAEGFQALTSLAQSQDINLSMLGHFECRKNWALGQLGLVEESARGYDSVIEGRSTVLGPDDPETLDAQHSLAKMLVLNGQGTQAIPLLESLVEHRARVLGERHPDTLETWKYLHLARMQAEPGNGRALARAIRKLEHILRTQDESHGPDHPMTRDTAAWLPKLQRRQGQLRFPGEPPDLVPRHRKKIPDDMRPALLVTNRISLHLARRGVAAPPADRLAQERQ